MQDEKNKTERVYNEEVRTYRKISWNETNKNRILHPTMWDSVPTKICTLCNFNPVLDVGGGVKEEQVRAAFQIIIDEKVKAVLHNFFGVFSIVLQ